MGNMKPTAEEGALTLALLVQNYRSQITALLIKNGVVVNDGTSDRQMAVLVTNLLKVSKSFAKDLNDFINNPKVAENIASGIGQTAEYFRMSGSPFLNVFGQFSDTSVPDSIGYESPYGLGTSSSSTTATTDPVLNSASNITSGDSSPTWFSGIKANLGNYINSGLELLLQMDKNKADVKIADAQVKIAQAGGGTKVLTTEEEADDKNKDGASTTTIVVLSLVGVAVLGTIIYFMTRPKN